MNITVIGTGYVGLIAGLGFADFGNHVICLDIEQEKIDKLKMGICPIYEKGAETLLRHNLDAGRIEFTTDKKVALTHGSVVFIAVGTPENEKGEADLTYVLEAADDIATHMEAYQVIVDKSTVPVGTSVLVTERIAAKQRELGKNVDFDVASNPEFLREGRAVGDFTNPDRIVLGVRSERAGNLLKQLYKVFARSNKPVIVTTPETAEMIKYASNAFLATKITFVNELANLCEVVGADIREVAAAMGKDGRISPKFLHPGPGYGGSCFPKDTKAIAVTGRQCGVPLTIIESVISANARQKILAAEKIKKQLPLGGNVAILGLSFKPETDDVRESPALEIIRILSKNSAFHFRVYDPKSMDEARKQLGDIKNITWCPRMENTFEDSDALVIVTEWAEFYSLDMPMIKAKMKGNLFFDLRDIYDRSSVEREGFTYFGTGV